MPINKNAYGRYKVIDMLLRNRMRPYPTMQDIIEACREKLGLNISHEAIQKDINLMKRSHPEGFDAPIQYNFFKRGYEYTDPDYSISEISLSPDDVGAIKESIELIRTIGGSRVSEKFSHAMEKILSTVLEEFPTGENKETILQTMTPPKSRGFEHFDLLYRACKEKIPVSFVHYNYKKREFKATILHTVLIKEFDNKWYVIGYSEKHEEVRIFGFDRIYDPICLKKKFANIDKAKLVNEYKDCYGVLTIPDQAPSGNNYYTSTVTTDGSPLTTFQLDIANLTGNVSVQASTDATAYTVDWYDVDFLDLKTGNTVSNVQFSSSTERLGINVVGFHPFIRLEFGIDAGNVDLIQYR